MSRDPEHARFHYLHKVQTSYQANGNIELGAPEAQEACFSEHNGTLIVWPFADY